MPFFICNFCNVIFCPGQSGQTTGSNVIKVIGNTSDTGYRSHDVLDPTGLSTTLMSRDYKGPKQVAVKQVGNISNSKSFGGNPQGGRVYGTDGISPTLTAHVAKEQLQVAVNQVGNVNDSDSFGGNPQTGRVYDPEGLSPTLNTMTGGGREPKVLVSKYERTDYGKQVRKDYESKKVKLHRSQIRHLTFKESSIGNTLTTVQKDNMIAIPVSSPNRIKKRQNGRRFKTNGEPEFTLTGQDRHGILTNNLRIRKLTPRECWRLQGFPDWAFDKAQEVNSNSQLYKQAGNSVTVPLMEFVAKRMTESNKNLWG